MNDMVKQVEQTGERDINTITTEICTIKDQAQRIILAAAIEIGRRLTEAKALVPYGEWGNYLKEKVEFSTSTANNMMRVAKEYGDQQVTLFGMGSNPQAFANLSYTQALKLLALPEDERVEFVAQHDVDNMSTRELEKAIRQREDAVKAQKQAEEKAEAAERARRELQDRVEAAEQSATIDAQKAAEMAKQLEDMAADLAKKSEAAKKAKAKLKELQNNPEVPPEVLDRFRREAEETAKAAADAKAKETLAEMEKEKAAAERAAADARREAEEAARKLDDMEKQVKMASPDVAVFKATFEQIQEDWNKMQRALEKVQDSHPDVAANLQAAVVALIKRWGDDK